MSKPTFLKNKEHLAARLRDEAQAARPEFSEALHARICGALPLREAAAVRRGAPIGVRWRWAFVAVAATCLVAISLAAWRLNRAQDPMPTPPETAVADPETDESPQAPELVIELPAIPTEGITVLVDSTLSAGQWAYLDHDARLLGQMLRDPLPLDMLAADDFPVSSKTKESEP